MKRFFTFLLISVSVIFFTSCGGGGAQKPEDVAEKFLKHLNNMEFSEAKELATDETAKMLSMMEGMMSSMGDKAKKKKEGNFKEILETNVDGDKAVVKYCCDKEGKEDKVDLKKIDGEWKVHMKKEAPGGGAGAKSAPVKEEGKEEKE